MKAIQIYQFGSTEELKYEDAPKPSIEKDEVLIKVYASGVNPVDWKIREGYMKEKVHYTFPLILGWDVSGIVEETGEDVHNFKKGDAVYGRPDTSRNGSYAEYIAVRATELSLKPQSLSYTETAGVALAGLTAWQGVIQHGELQPGQKILIQGASGGVGSFAVQFAKWKGAYVIGTASEKNAAFLKDLGADEVIDYHNEGFEKNLKDIDVVFDTRGGEDQKKIMNSIKQGGILVSTVGIADQKALDEKGIKGKSYMAQSIPGDLTQIATLIDEGKVKPVISKVLPLEQAAEAHKMSEEGHTRGKIVLEVRK